jgi:small redox-active disulfide protein 2
MDNDVMEIFVGGKKIGLVNLPTIFKEVQGLGLTNRVRIMAELLRRTRTFNYIPVSAEMDYCNALYNEFLRYQGIKVGAETGFMEILILGPGCPRCEELMKNVKNAVAELGFPANIEHVKDLKSISSFGPAPTPGLVINGKLKLAGKVPSPDDIKKMLT